MSPAIGHLMGDPEKGFYTPLYCRHFLSLVSSFFVLAGERDLARSSPKPNPSSTAVLFFVGGFRLGLPGGFWFVSLFWLFLFFSFGGFRLELLGGFLNGGHMSLRA